jgi:hypothetical protein
MQIKKCFTHESPPPSIARIAGGVDVQHESAKLCSDLGNLFRSRRIHFYEAAKQARAACYLGVVLSGTDQILVVNLFAVEGTIRRS